MKSFGNALPFRFISWELKQNKVPLKYLFNIIIIYFIIYNTVILNFNFQEEQQSISGQDGYTTDEPNQIQSPDLSTASLSSHSSRKRPVSRKEDVSNKKVLQLVAQRLQKEDVKPGQHDNFGKHIADELNNMSPEMLPHVKKIINMAIYEGQMKTLNSMSSIVTPQSGNYHVQPPSSSNPNFIYQPPNYHVSSHQLTTLQPMQVQHRQNVQPPDKPSTSVSEFYSHFSDVG